MESTAYISLPSARVRGKGEGPPIETCEHFAAFTKYAESQSLVPEPKYYLNSIFIVARDFQIEKMPTQIAQLKRLERILLIKMNFGYSGSKVEAKLNFM